MWFAVKRDIEDGVEYVDEKPRTKEDMNRIAEELKVAFARAGHVIIDKKQDNESD